MPAGIIVLQRIGPGVEEAVVVDDRARVRHDGVRAQERAQGRVVVAGVVVQQAGAALPVGRQVLLLAGVRAVRLQVPAAAADGVSFFPLNRSQKPLHGRGATPVAGWHQP